ncbi:hypothetical protein FRX31_020320, partial [Thalictrum thalictroides]
MEDFEGSPLFNNPLFDEAEEEVVRGDRGEFLVTHRICLTPKDTEGDARLRNNIFRSSCTIGGK